MVNKTTSDIDEDYVLQTYPELLEKLLIDKTTKNNIFWATDEYQGIKKDSEITFSSIVGKPNRRIKPRALKTKEAKAFRTKVSAEVFTPSWICNLQNNLIDDSWFNSKNVFNTPFKKTWKTNLKKIIFPDGKSWKDYVKNIRLEIGCGEAPYLVSRYDSVTGKIIPIKDRIGLLDRKLRVINEQTKNELEWFEWVLKAYKSCYGYEYQGDSLLLARENFLFSFIDYVQDRFNRVPSKKELYEVVNIITWNLWQMDGITMTVPFSSQLKEGQLSFFDNQMEQLSVFKKLEEPVPCRIYDWKANKSIEFRTLIKKQ